MALVGKISTEFWVNATVSKLFDFYSKQLDQVQHITDKIHAGKLHQGHDWHLPDSVKHWTYIIDGKVTQCFEKTQIDEGNKTIKFILSGGDVAKQFKKLNLCFQALDKSEGGAIVTFNIEYEKINDDTEPPFGYAEYVYKVTKDADDHLLKA